MTGVLEMCADDAAEEREQTSGADDAATAAVSSQRSQASRVFQEGALVWVRSPASPGDAQLRQGYLIWFDDLVCQWQVCLADGTGKVVRVKPSDLEHAAEKKSRRVDGSASFKFPSSVLQELDREDHRGRSQWQLGEPQAFARFLSVQPARSDHGEGLSLRKILYNWWMETFIGMVLMLNFVLVCLDVDARADFPGRQEGGRAQAWVYILMHICFVVFLIELLARFAVERSAIIDTRWNCVDMVFVGCGMLEYILHWLGIDPAGGGVVRVLQLARLLRLVRMLRLFSFMDELRKLIMMMGSCAKTLLWSSLLLVLAMTLWAAIAVDYINPIVAELTASGAWADCERCSRSFASIFMANITLWQTIVAGDSWGTLAIPIIEAYPMSAFVFAGSLMTLVFGILNLIVAVIVDTFAENRETDMLTKAQDMKDTEAKEKKTLSQMFTKIDENGDGTLSLDELEDGARTVAEFRNWLRVLDIDGKDLRLLFMMVDADGSGEIDPDEFIEAMYRMKNSESKTTARFVKHMVERLDWKHDGLQEAVEEMEVKVANFCKSMQKFLDKQGGAFEKMRSQSREFRASYEQVLEDKLCAYKDEMHSSVSEALGKAVDVAVEAALRAASPRALPDTLQGDGGGGSNDIDSVEECSVDGGVSSAHADDPQQLSTPDFGPGAGVPSVASPHGSSRPSSAHEGVGSRLRHL